MSDYIRTHPCTQVPSIAAVLKHHSSTLKKLTDQLASPKKWDSTKLDAKDTLLFFLACRIHLAANELKKARYLIFLARRKVRRLVCAHSFCM